MKIHNQNFKEMQEAKKERYEELADKNHNKASAEFEASRKMADVIPFGQPILVGHHSEKADRNYRKRIENKMQKSIETSKKAEYYDQKVKGIENNYAIRQDDPEAIKLLKEKIIKLQEEHKRIKALPKQPRDYSFSEIDMRSCHLTSLSTKMRTAKKRIEEIQKLEALDDVDVTINKIRIYTEDGRVRVDFGYKPSEETRTTLKRSGFRWSPYNQVWQAYIHQHTIDKAQEIAKNEADN